MRIVRLRHRPGAARTPLLLLAAFICLTIALAFLAASEPDYDCGCDEGDPPAAPDCSRKADFVLGSTTSLRDTGLLQKLVSDFQKETGIQVEVRANGSGAALEEGRRGCVDALLVHSPAEEETFMAEEHGYVRRTLFSNDYVLVGPLDDPARSSRAKSISAALARIRDRDSSFVSRGDNSGTHMREVQLWGRITSSNCYTWPGPNCFASKAGMLRTLKIAAAKRAYTLSDRATYLTWRAQAGKKPPLRIVWSGTQDLHNPYSLILVNPETHPWINEPAGQKFLKFMTSARTRKTISTFGKDRFHQSLFRLEETPPGKPCATVPMTPVGAL